jgi:hypothetical protein
MNTQHGCLDQLERWTRVRYGAQLRRALAVGLLMIAVARVSVPMALAEGVPQQIADLQQQVTAMQATVNNQATQIYALQATVNNGTGQISGLLEVLSNETSQISALQTTVSSQTSQISGLQDVINSQAERLSVLTNLLASVSLAGNDLYITGANLHIVNGLGSTGTTNGLGNLIVGYNELRGMGDDRSGSHNLVVGSMHNFSSSGGFVAGLENSISGSFPSISGGSSNIVSGVACEVDGGYANEASGDYTLVSGGYQTGASGTYNWSGACGLSCQY